ncbi:hypothetical protein FDECE_15979 [Fusarium decemcellulare]|nr:hypothetical protein FDECE_15979 [Fusarium decemcellulare]
MERLAVKDLTFSDGTFVPKGTSVGVISHGRHMDDDIVPDATTFDAFRYEKARAQPGMENQFTFGQASQDNLLFGLGKHACPGRHFASVLIKLVLTHILAHYDIKFIDGRSPPSGTWTQKFRNPDFGYLIDWKYRKVDSCIQGAFP